MLYTRKIKLAVTALFASLILSGCAGSLTRGADTQSVSDIRSARQVWQDNNVEFEAAAISNKSPFKGQARIAANSYRGRVVLMGQVPTEEMKQQVTEQVKEVAGVSKVYNQLRVEPIIGVSQMSRDSWITTKVKSAFAREAKLKGASIKVITENNEVFLFGYVTAEHANVATEVARNVSDVKHVIRGFVVASNAIDDVEKAAKPEKKEATVEDLTESTPATPEATTTQPKENLTEEESVDYVDSSSRIVEEDI